MIACVNIMSMRATIYIYNSRILLVGVEVGRLNHSPVEVGLTVGCLNRTTAVFRHIIALPWVFSLEIAQTPAVLCIYDGYVARNSRSGVTVKYILSTCAKCGCVPSLATLVHKSTLAVASVYYEDVALYRTKLV